MRKILIACLFILVMGGCGVIKFVPYKSSKDMYKCPASQSGWRWWILGETIK